MRPQSNAPSDTMSEISEASTTGTERSSCFSDYRDELQEFATSLGFKNADEMAFDRFKVDRKRLECMLLGNAECANSAHEFFQKIMKETQTLIKWPSQLKIGAKSKKDPHIKIFGLPKDVATAKKCVMAVLDTRSTRVTMKLDVSYTDHSHIIGKGGLRIKCVMEETSCHIHFPDSNRNNQEEKSNQVSIAGEMANIEQARARVRELTPLIFCFELPNVGTLQSFPELTSPFVLEVQERYNVQVMFRTRAKLHSTLVMVKGCDWEVIQVKAATIHLINHMCGAFANQVKVQMMLEISPQYHSIVLGEHQQNVKKIMEHTGVQILFPDPHDPYTPSLKKSSVTISGSIHKVYAARQMLLGSLPLVLMFEVTPESVSLKAINLDELMQSLDVYISIRPKPKQNVFSVVIKGLEKNAGNMYEARRRLIGSDEVIAALIPKTYRCPGPVPTFLRSFSATGNNLHNLPNNFFNNNRPLPCSPLPFELIKPLMQSLPTDLSYNFRTPTNSPRPNGTSIFNNSSPMHNMPIQQKNNNWLMTDLLQSIGGLGRQKFPYFQAPDNKVECPAYSSCLSSDTSSLSTSPRTASPISNLMENTTKLDLNELPERRAPGFERSVGNANYNVDYQQLRIQAAQAMQGVPNRSEVRVPTPNWSGYGFSQSSPSAIGQNRAKEEITNTDEEIGNKNLFIDPVEGSNHFAASNYLDAAASSTFNVVTSSNYTDLPSQLASLGLQKYTQLFKSHEIDLGTFQTLTEADLREIGVTALGARRKMMLFISELKKREQMNLFRGSAAPGAERQSSSTNSSPQQDNSW
ncbi:hypothetical protein V9T40_004229 [Parthenolecanium corni]|uniref:SAM domain-containing protein n=1 Tax=Parthenolecanium corni TaxID=536013 RepID=A0AAN9TTN0_9HEMI